VVYKYWEVYTQGMLSRFSLSSTIEQTGALTSMSQNLSGLMSAMLLIEGLVHKNLIMSLLRSGHLSAGPVGFHINHMISPKIGKLQGTNPGSSLPVGSQFSPGTTEN